MSEAKPKVVALAGSLRTGSFNKKLLAIAVRIAKDAGADVEVLDLRALALPIYDQDIQDRGMPEGAVTLIDKLAAAQGLMIASPEYNYSVPGGLKNAIDWVSRAKVNPLKDKVAVLMGASGGIGASLRLNLAIRPVLAVLGMWITPGYVGVPLAAQAFDDAGELKEPTLKTQLDALVKQFVGKLGK